jgi:hypothetical protein
MQHEGSLAVVRAWQDAANRRDVDRLVELSDPDIEVIGPRGSGKGHQLLCDWLRRAGLTLETRRAFVRGNVVVAAQHGVWRSVESGDVTGEADVASLFRVDRQRVVQFARYDSLDEALKAAGLNDQDETPPG